MKIYADVSLIVKPKKEQVAKLNTELEIVEKELQEKVSALNKVKANVQKLKDETDLVVQEKANLEYNMQLTEKRLERA